MKSQILPSFAAVALLGALILAGEMDYQDQVDQEANYCARVAAGDWPDYRGDFREKCPQAAATAVREGAQ